MDLKKTLKSVALAGMTFAAGFGAFHLTHQKSDKTPSKAPTHEKVTVTQGSIPQDFSLDEIEESVPARATSSPSSQRRVITYQKETYDTYELRSDVLIPKAGESQEDYEARRIRLEKQNRKLHKKMAEEARQIWEQLKREGADPRLVSAAAKRYADHLDGTKATYYSIFTEIGQGKLKYGNAYKGNGRIGSQMINYLKSQKDPGDF